MKDSTIVIIILALLGLGVWGFVSHVQKTNLKKELAVEIEKVGRLNADLETSYLKNEQLFRSIERVKADLTKEPRTIYVRDTIVRSMLREVERKVFVQDTIYIKERLKELKLYEGTLNFRAADLDYKIESIGELFNFEAALLPKEFPLAKELQREIREKYRGSSIGVTFLSNSNFDPWMTFHYARTKNTFGWQIVAGYFPNDKQFSLGAGININF